MNNHKECVFVIGMHRCGTSVLTSMISDLGYNLGDTLMPGNEFNENGYFENLLVVKKNDGILKSAGTKWSSTSYINLDYDRLYGQFKNDIERIIKSEFGNSKLICIKDPRLSILLPIWYRVLSENLFFKCKVIIAFREPSEVIFSLRMRDHFSYEKSCLLYSKYLLLAERNSRILRRLAIDYSELCENTKFQMFRIANFLNINNNRYILGATHRVKKKYRKNINSAFDNYFVSKCTGIIFNQYLKLEENLNHYDLLDRLWMDFKTITTSYSYKDGLLVEAKKRIENLRIRQILLNAHFSIELDELNMDFPQLSNFEGTKELSENTNFVREVERTCHRLTELVKEEFLNSNSSINDQKYFVLSSLLNLELLQRELARVSRKA